MARSKTRAPALSASGGTPITALSGVGPVLAEKLAARGLSAAAIHGDLGQGAREQALRAFRNGKVDILVATDVAARGIDVDNVTHVVNYQCVEDEKIYLHRVGRTGRPGGADLGTASAATQAGRQ